MVLGLCAAALGVASRPLGFVTAAVARVPLAYLEGLAARLARSPLPSLTARPGSLVQILTGVALVGAVAVWVRGRVRVPQRAALAAGLAATVALSTAAARTGPPPWLTVTFFSVGWGDAALVSSPGGATILIDGGPDSQLVATDLGWSPSERDAQVAAYRASVAAERAELTRARCKDESRRYPTHWSSDWPTYATSIGHPTWSRH